MKSDKNKQYLDEKWPEVRAEILKKLKDKGHVTDLVKLPKESLEALYSLARSAYSVEDYRQAEDLFSGMVMFEGSDLRGWLGYGGACEAQKKWQQAAVAYAMATGLLPGDPVGPYRAGICLMNLNQPKQARETFELAAGCRKEMENNPKKLPYVQRAESMLEMLDSKKGE